MKTVLVLIVLLIAGYIGYTQMLLRQAENEAAWRGEMDRNFTEALVNANKEADNMKAEFSRKDARHQQLVEWVGEAEARRIEEKGERESREKRMLELQEEEVRLLREK